MLPASPTPFFDVESIISVGKLIFKCFHIHLVPNLFNLDCPFTSGSSLLNFSIVFRQFF